MVHVRHRDRRAVSSQTIVCPIGGGSHHLGTSNPDLLLVVGQFSKGLDIRHTRRPRKTRVHLQAWIIDSLIVILQNKVRAFLVLVVGIGAEMEYVVLNDH